MNCPKCSAILAAQWTRCGACGHQRKALASAAGSAADVERAFRAELQALLDKWDAEIEAKDHWQGYAECGEDIRMTVDIPALYDGDHNRLRDWTEIDLGAQLFPQNAPGDESPPNT